MGVQNLQDILYLWRYQIKFVFFFLIYEFVYHKSLFLNLRHVSSLVYISSIGGIQILNRNKKKIYLLFIMYK